MTSTNSTSDVLDAIERTAADVAAATLPSVVAIGRDGRGSGVVIAPDRVLTNAHNLRDRTTTVTFEDGEGRQGEVVAADRAGDLAVLAVSTGDAPSLEWSDGGAGVGTVVVAVSRGRLAPRVTLGLVSAVDRTFRGPRGRPIAGALEHTAPLGRGATGGPLVDRDGRIVALNTHRLDDGFSLARSADDDLRVRVGELLAGEAPGQLTLGLAIAPAEVARRLRRSVGLAERDGLLVRAVDPRGPAGRAGVDVGDLVVRAAGRDVARAEELFEVLATHDPATTLDLGLVRGTEEIELVVSFEPDAPTEEGSA